MFTGIVEEVGTVVSITPGSTTGTSGTAGTAAGEADARLTVRGPLVTSDAALGDSISVSGVCLTVADLPGDGTFTADVMPESLRRTALGSLVAGSPVNLERAVRADARLGGHVVQGHVDGVGTILSRTPGARWDDVVVRLPAELAGYVAEKGSIAVSGVSLTVTHVGPDTFGVSLIPTTLAATTLGDLAPGSAVNLEVDVIAKYVERLLATGHGGDPVSATSETVDVDAVPPRLGTVEEALAELRAGRPVLVADSPDRENEADIVLAAQSATPEWVGWTIRHSSGYLCAPMTGARADALDLPLMVPSSQDPRRTAYTVTVDAAHGVATGISAADRARTLRVLADPASGAGDLIRPGHVLPLRAVPGGVLHRAGHTEAAVDLCRLAGLEPVGGIAELVNDDGTMTRLPQAAALAASDGLVLLTIEDLIAWRREHDAEPWPDTRTGTLPGSRDGASADAATPAVPRVHCSGIAALPTKHGSFRVHGYRDLRTGADHVALVSVHALGDDPVVRVHSECLTGDAFGSLRCDCGPQLDAALERTAEEGGVVVYLRGHEGRGIGLLAKIGAYALQDAGRDTVQANIDLGWPADRREYGAAAAILADLGVRRLRLLTNNPAKVAGLRAHGLDVTAMVPLEVGRTPENLAYLRTKAVEMGHLLALPDDEPDPTPATAPITTSITTSIPRETPA